MQRIRTRNHKFPKQTLNHLAELACVVSTYLYGTFGCAFFSCHIRILE